MNSKQTELINKAISRELEAKLRSIRILNRLKKSIDTEGREWC